MRGDARHHAGGLGERCVGPLCRCIARGEDAVVIRRLFGGLRDSGLVASEKGHGGGWALAQPLEKITLPGVYRAVGEPPLFSDLVSEDHPECLVEQAVNAHLPATSQNAEAVMLARSGKLTLAGLMRGVRLPVSRGKASGKRG